MTLENSSNMRRRSLLRSWTHSAMSFVAVCAIVSLHHVVFEARLLQRSVRTELRSVGGALLPRLHPWRRSPQELARCARRNLSPTPTLPHKGGERNVGSLPP